MEEALVDRIIMVLWRQRRLHTAECGEIAKAINDAQSPEGPDHTEMLFKLSQNDPGMPALPESLLGWKTACQALKVVRDAIERDSALSGEELKKYYETVGRTYAYLIDAVMKAQSKIAEDPESSKLVGTGTLREHIMQKLLPPLEVSIKEAESRLKEHLARQSATERADKSAAMLPSSEALDKILRYETTLERQLYRALNQLERLQRTRLGEVIPPPISIIT